MRNSWMLLAVVLSGCNGATPQIFDLVVDYFTLPDSCYTSGMQPSTSATTRPPAFMAVQIWDAPENTAYLQVEKGATTIDMGAAPNVPISGIFIGKKVEKGWTFTSDTVIKQTLAGPNTITDTIHAEITFDRVTTSKGSAAVSSSRNCVGNQCPGTNPSCSVSGIVVNATRVAVEFERAP